MTFEKIIGLVLIIVGAALASLTLFQHASATLPVHVALPWAAVAILTGAIAFRVGQRTTVLAAVRGPLGRHALL